MAAMLSKVRQLIVKRRDGLVILVLLGVWGALISASVALLIAFIAILPILLVLLAYRTDKQRGQEVANPRRRRRRRVVVPYAQYRYLSKLHTETVRYVPNRRVRWRHRTHNALSTASNAALLMLVMLSSAVPIGFAAIWLAGLTRADWIAFNSDLPPDKLIIEPVPTEGCGLVPCHYEPVFHQHGEQTVVTWERVDDSLPLLSTRQ